MSKETKKAPTPDGYCFRSFLGKRFPETWGVYANDVKNTEISLRTGQTVETSEAVDLGFGKVVPVWLSEKPVK